MTDDKNRAAARNMAERRVLADNSAQFRQYLAEEYEAAGLPAPKPRLSKEERAARDEARAKEAAAAKIRAMAEKAGIGVLLVDDAKIEEKVAAAHDGTAEGVEHPDYPWDKAEPPAEEEGLTEQA